MSRKLVTPQPPDPTILGVCLGFLSDPMGLSIVGVLDAGQEFARDGRVREACELYAANLVPRGEWASYTPGEKVTLSNRDLDANFGVQTEKAYRPLLDLGGLAVGYTCIEDKWRLFRQPPLSPLESEVVGLDMAQWFGFTLDWGVGSRMATRLSKWSIRREWFGRVGWSFEEHAWVKPNLVGRRGRGPARSRRGEPGRSEGPQAHWRAGHWRTLGEGGCRPGLLPEMLTRPDDPSRRGEARDVEAALVGVCMAFHRYTSPESPLAVQARRTHESIAGQCPACVAWINASQKFPGYHRELRGGTHADAN